MLIPPGALGLTRLSLGLNCQYLKEEATATLTLPFQPMHRLEEGGDQLLKSGKCLGPKVTPSHALFLPSPAKVDAGLDTSGGTRGTLSETTCKFRL